MRRRLLLLLLLAGLVFPGAFPGAPLQAEESRSSGLQGVWKELVGKTGYLEPGECRYIFTLAIPGQTANATVAEVHTDHVIFIERRDGKTEEWVIPLAQLTLRRPGR